jgi:hypothetical protein
MLRNEKFARAMVQKERKSFIPLKKNLAKRCAMRKFSLMKHKSMSWKYGGNLLEGAG